jgi:protein-L-isoaspartate(D-aspartate) O-methyltransferase
MSLDFERARFNMVECQVRTWEVLDQRVLDVLRQVRREDFVPARYRKLAFADVQIPLELGEVMMKPVVEGRMLQALALAPEQCVLEVGTGSGFVTTCLAQLAREVVSVEQHAALAERARGRIAATGAANVRIEVGDAVLKFDPNRQFDAVCVTGAVATVPERFKRWLRVGGRMFVIRGEAPAMEAVLITRLEDDQFQEQSLFETDLPYLAHAAPRKRFCV